MRVPRHAVVWWPHWGVVAVDPAPGEPVAVWHAHRVAACTPSARAEGVRVGQRRREAQGRCPLLRWEPADPDRAARAFEPVVRAVTEMVPRLEVGDPGSLAFLARGPSRYFGGEDAMAQRVLEVVGTSGVTPVGLDPFPGIGVADGRFAADLAARLSVARGVPLLVAPGVEATRAFLAPQGLSALHDLAEVPADLVDLWRRLGLRRLGDLAALDPDDVVGRFGRVGRRAHLLACGDDDRPPDERAPLVAQAVSHGFEPPVSNSDAAVFIARQLAERLITGLASEGRLCTRLVVVAETEHGERSERCWGRSTGFGVATVVERVRWQLDGWARQEALTAGISLLRLDPVEIRRDTGMQPGLWGGRTQADDWAQRAITRVVGLVGEESVRVPAPRGGRRAHREVPWVPVSTVDLADPPAAGRWPTAGSPWPGRIPGPAPSVLHDPPLEVMVVDAAGVVVRVAGRGEMSGVPAQVDGEAVHAWAGPWPVDERWWSGQSHRSARLQVLTGSGRLLLLEVVGGRWWLVAEHR
ncbi:MAG: DNA polymerase Y family protein [Ilumatobacteraceae bacterium]